MEDWSAHLLFSGSRKTHSDAISLSIQRYAQRLRERNLPVIFSLAHLSRITSVNYFALHETVTRKRERHNYNLFAIRKRSGGKRFVHAVNGDLKIVQQFLNDAVLENIPQHPCSFAFHKNGGTRQCAQIHSGCKWLLKFDLKDFFTSINEADIYTVFHKSGYRKLLSFELARICTTTHLPESLKDYLHSSSRISRWIGNDPGDNLDETNFPYTPTRLLGVLPQGAPTSPKLSNIVAYPLDKDLSEYALENGFVFSRYADDITFSAMSLPQGKRIGKIISEINHIIRRNGFLPNESKTHVAGPGSRKMVLGLLVDQQSPGISKMALKRIDRNIYSIEKFGPALAASHDKFESTFGYINHVSGLLSYLKDVDHRKWAKYKRRFDTAVSVYSAIE